MKIIYKSYFCNMYDVSIKSNNITLIMYYNMYFCLISIQFLFINCYVLQSLLCFIIVLIIV